MNSESPLPKLPSLSELLQHPTVEKVVQRVNQSTVAQRAAGFLTEWQANLLEKRDKSLMPTLNHLAERLAQRLLGQPVFSSPIVNATGLVCSKHWRSPLPDEALQEMVRAGSEYYEAAPSLQKQAVELLQEFTGAEAVWVVSSYQGALKLVAQCEEVSAEPVHYAGLIDPEQFGLLPVRSLRAHLEAGAEVILCDGAGLVGGPSCGILLGRADKLDILRQHDWAEVLEADALTLLALATTLSLYREESKVVHQIPVWQLLTAPLENLQQRCERLSPLLAESPWLEKAEPVEYDSPWFETAQMRLAGKSWAVKLSPSSSSMEELSEQLKSVIPQVIPRQTEEEMWLDLRSVMPRWDQQLVEAFQSS